MTRAFSKSYLHLFERAVTEPEGILVPRDSVEESRNLRTYLYHFRKELRQSNPRFLEGKYQDLKFHVEPEGLRVKLKTAPGDENIEKALASL